MVYLSLNSLFEAKNAKSVENKGQKYCFPHQEISNVNTFYNPI